MAKQVGPLFITGTIDGIIFYKLGDQYYMRSKGSYKSGKQMRKDPRLKRTMQNAYRFGEASKIVKYVYYRQLPRAVRKPGLFGKLTGMVNQWLYQGKSEEEAEAQLIAYCQTLVQKTSRDETTATTPATEALTMADTTTDQMLAKTSKGRRVKKPTHQTKQARYISCWKVKPNGRLHIPKRQLAACRPRVIPLAYYHPDLVSASVFRFANELKE